MLSSILLPVDGSRFSEQALPLACLLARHGRAPLHIVRVHDPLAAFMPPTALEAPLAYDRELDDQFRIEEEEQLRGLADRAAERSGVTATAHLLEGTVVEAIHEYAAAIGTGLIVMTTHGRGGLSRAWLGSVADRLVREARLPTLLLRPQEGDPPADREPEIRSILLPLDGSDLAERALQPALELARTLRAQLSLLRVIPPAYEIGSPYSPTTVRLDADTVARREADAEAYLSAVEARLRDHELGVDHQILRHPHPGQAILEHAIAEDADLIALSTRGRGGLRRLALGSVADKVVRGAETPVLVVPAPPE